MQVKDVLSFLFESSGKSKYRISQDLGHHRNWASNQVARTRNPTLGTVVDVAHLDGFAVALLDSKGQVIATIEQSENEDNTDQ